MIWGLCRCIFHQAPLALQPGNMLQYFAGLKDQTKQIAFDSASAGKWWLVPRDGGEPRLIDTEPGMIWHYGNAFEDASGAAKGLALYKQPSCASVCREYRYTTYSGVPAGPHVLQVSRENPSIAVVKREIED